MNDSDVNKLLHNEYLTMKEMAQLSHCAYATIKRHIERGELPAYHIGRKYFIQQADARIYLERQAGKRDLDGYTIKEIMDIIPLSYAFIIELIRQGRLPAVKVGRQYVIPKDAFTKFIADNKLAGQEDLPILVQK